MVGTFGSTDERALLLIAIARSLPPCTFDRTDCSGSNMIWVWPAIRSVTRRRAALVGDVLDVDAGCRLEHLAGQVTRRADACRAVVELARHLLCERHQFGEIADRLRRMDDDGDRRHRDHRDRREVAQRIVGQLLVKRRIDRMRADRRHEQRLAVRRGLGDGIGPKRTAGSSAVVDDDR